MMKHEGSLIHFLGARKYAPKKSNLNFELPFNYKVHQIIESKDDELCMYDYAKEILELLGKSEET